MSSFLSFLITSFLYLSLIWGIWIYTPTLDIDKISEKFNSTTVTLVKTKNSGQNLIDQKEKILSPLSPPTQPPKKPQKKECCKKSPKSNKDLKTSKLGLLKPKEKPKPPEQKRPQPQAPTQKSDKKEQKRSIAKKGGKREVILFFKEIKKAIAKNRIYPRRARQKGITGEVKATFTIEQNGTISNIALRGKRIFFESAKRALKKIEPINTKDAPFNLPLRVSITLKYRLK